MNDISILFMILIAFEVKNFISAFVIRAFVFSHVDREGDYLVRALTRAALDGLSTALIIYFATSAAGLYSIAIGAADFFLQLSFEVGFQKFDEKLKSNPLLSKQFARSSDFVDRSVWLSLGTMQAARRIFVIAVLWILSSDGLIYLQ